MCNGEGYSFRVIEGARESMVFVRIDGMCKYVLNSSLLRREEAALFAMKRSEKEEG